MRCKGCWHEEGGRCYTGEFARMLSGRSTKLATERCSAFCCKRAALESVIPGDKLIISSEGRKKLPVDNGSAGHMSERDE